MSRCLIFQLPMEEYIPGMPLLTAEMSARQAGMFPSMLNWKHSKLFLEGKLLPVYHLKKLVQLIGQLRIQAQLTPMVLQAFLQAAVTRQGTFTTLILMAISGAQR